MSIKYNLILRFSNMRCNKEKKKNLKRRVMKGGFGVRVIIFYGAIQSSLLHQP